MRIPRTLPVTPFLLVLIPLLSFFTPRPAIGDGNLVEVDVAQRVAAYYLPKFYPGEWVDFTHYVLYGLDGQPSAYAVVFRRPDSPISTPEELDSVAAAAYDNRKPLDAALAVFRSRRQRGEPYDKAALRRLKRAVRKENATIYQFATLATVVTGARETSPLLIRCYRGLPAVVAEREAVLDELQTEHPGEGLDLGRILFFGANSVRYEIVRSGGNATTAAPGATSPRAVSSHSYTVRVKSRDLKPVSEERRHLADLKREQTEQLETLGESDRKAYVEALERRKQRHIERWRKFKMTPVSRAGASE